MDCRRVQLALQRQGRRGLSSRAPLALALALQLLMVLQGVVRRRSSRVQQQGHHRQAALGRMVARTKAVASSQVPPLLLHLQVLLQALLQALRGDMQGPVAVQQQ